jgi:ABC-type uncharacterized transport system substrate-binding protein
MKDNQHEQLFTELTSAEAAIVEGGKRLDDYLLFDDRETTQPFTVRPDSTVKLDTDTFNLPSSAFNPTFYAAIRNVKSGNKVEKVARVGKNTTTWTHMKAGTYVIDFRDKADGTLVAGPATVTYS